METNQFATVDAWRAALGLLPVPLRDTPISQDQYVLLNGSTGNFCLDLVGGVELDCAPPAGEFSPRFEVGAISGFGLLNRHFVFLRG